MTDTNTPASVVELFTDAADSEPSVLADAHQIVMRTIYGDRLIDMGATLGVPSMVTFDQAVRAAATTLRNQPSVDDVIEQCAKVADNYARTQREAGAEGSFDAADIAEHIAQAIRNLASGKATQ